MNLQRGWVSNGCARTNTDSTDMHGQHGRARTYTDRIGVARTCTDGTDVHGQHGHCTDHTDHTDKHGHTRTFSETL